jgi:hypothetical protein
MKKILLILPILFWLGCEENEDNDPIVYPLPTEFPLDKEYTWEYERTYFNSATEMLYGINPDTSYLETLYVKPTENIYSYYWWANYPSHKYMVLNDEDNFVEIGYVDLVNDTTVFRIKPNLWASYSTIYDTDALSNEYTIFYKENRTTSIDTVDDATYHSYIFSGESADGVVSVSVSEKYNLFGYESVEVIVLFSDDLPDSEDIIYRIKKTREL